MAGSPAPLPYETYGNSGSAGGGDGIFLSTAAGGGAGAVSNAALLQMAESWSYAVSVLDDPQRYDASDFLSAQIISTYYDRVVWCRVVSYRVGIESVKAYPLLM